MNCPCCGSYRCESVLHRKELRTNGHGERPVEYWGCKDCGLVQKVGCADERGYYEQSWQFESSPHDVGALDLRKILFRHVFQFERAVDIGRSRDSQYLNALEWPNAITRERGIGPLIKSRRDGRVWLGSGGLSEEPHDCDLVTMVHVLEHALDIDQFLDDVDRFSTDHATFYIEVPSLEANWQYHWEFDDESWIWNEDLSRTHNYHFTVGALAALAQKRGWRILHLDTKNVDGMQSNRLVASKRPVDARAYIHHVSNTEIKFYAKNAIVLSGRDPKTTALYGASQSYYKFLTHAPKVNWDAFRLFDLYRADDTLLDKRVEHPDGLSEFEAVVVLPSFPPSRDACVAWLQEHHPHLEIVLAFQDGRGDTPPAPKRPLPPILDPECPVCGPWGGDLFILPNGGGVVIACTECFNAVVTR